MPNKRRGVATEWRKSLTTNEASRVAELETRIAALVDARALLSRELSLIRNRAAKRATFVPTAQRRALLASRAA